VEVKQFLSAFSSALASFLFHLQTAFLSRKTSRPLSDPSLFKQGFKRLMWAFCFNWVGSVIGASFFANACEFFEARANPVRQRILAMGQGKISSLVSRAMFCNWMVCLANILQAKTDSIAENALSNTRSSI
jgi:formate/nitrite transporter FocA (FNT family)